MIGKKVKNLDTSSKKRRVENLTSYIASPEQENGNEKCVHFEVEGFMTETMAGQQAEMVALAESNLRSIDPIEHYILSWPQGEIPTVEQAREAVQIIKKEMGMESLQIMWGVHVDTDDYHVHIAVNRIDPWTEKARNLCGGYDVYGLERAVALIEHKQGWQIEKNKRFFVLENGEAVQVLPDQDGPKVPPKKRDAEIRTGEKSALRLAQEQAAPILKKAASWAEVHEGLAAIGMRYERKGSGAVIKVGDDPVKASDVGKSFSIANMQRRLGDFVPADADLHVSERPREALDDVAVSCGWSEYSKERLGYVAAKWQAKAKLDEDIKVLRDALYQQQRREREQKLSGDWKFRGRELNMLRQTLAAEHAKQKAALQDNIEDMRRQYREQFPPLFENFEEWISKKKGGEVAEQWRNRDHVAEIHGTGATTVPEPRDIRAYASIIKGSTVSYINTHSGLTDFMDQGDKISILNKGDESLLAALQLGQQRFGKSLTLHGTDKYKTAAIRIVVAHHIQIANPELQQAITDEKERQRMERIEASKSSVRREFDRYHAALGADTYRVSSRSEENGKTWAMGRQEDGTIPGYDPQAIPWATIERFARRGGEHLYFTPMSKQYHLVMIDDTSPERIAQMRQAGYEPAYVQQSSPKSWQALLKFERIEPVSDPHLDAKHKSVEYRAVVALAQELNDRYGDPELQNIIQPHRIPGTPNPKAKYRGEDGRYPEVTIVEASGTFCTAGRDRLEELMRIEQAKDDELAAALAQSGNGQGNGKTMDVGNKGGALYDAFRQDIEKKVLKGPATELSHLDSMIALRMRAVGLSQAEIARIIETCTERDGRRHVWSEYATRTAEYAFGFKGTRDLERYARYVKGWQKIARDVIGEPIVTPAPAREKKDVEIEQEKLQQEQEQQRQEEQRKRRGPGPGGPGEH
jgi:hypothetical protein